MLGAILGDIIGSVYEFNNIKSKDFNLFQADSEFTDDSVLTIATAHAIIENRPFYEYYRKYALAYPGRGYGSKFSRWFHGSSNEPYNSFGNGSAMRVSPVAYISNSENKCLDLAKASAAATHNHPEGIKGAQATALSIYLALKGVSLIEIEKIIDNNFEYDMQFSLNEIRESYSFDETCQGTVPYALKAVFEAVSYEDAIRNAISIGGDSDTLACIAGSLAEAAFGIPDELKIEAYKYIPKEFVSIMESFFTHRS